MEHRFGSFFWADKEVTVPPFSGISGISKGLTRLKDMELLVGNGYADRVHRDGTYKSDGALQIGCWFTPDRIVSTCGESGILFVRA